MISIFVPYFLLSLCALVLTNGDQSTNGISTVRCDTTKGPITIEIYNDWAPNGAERFLNLVRDGFYTDIAMFRTVDKFLSQFGISSNPNFKWNNPKFKHHEEIKDDPNLGLGIKKHYICFAGSGADTRGTQAFIAFEDLNWLGPRTNEDGELDGTWETPIGKVVKGFDTLSKLYRGYGEKPDQNMIHEEGNDYVRQNFPLMDFINTCKIELNISSENAMKDSRTIDEKTAGVHLFAAIGDTEKVLRILKVVPDAVNLRDSNEWQPIHEATRSGFLETVKALIENGADMNSQTNNGGTPLWIAREELNPDHPLIAYLEDIGAEEIAEDNGL